MEQEGPHIRILVTGAGFLYNMVRILAGTLIAVGQGKIPAEKVAEPQPVYKVRITKNVSIKTVAKTASWRLESKDDVDKYLAALRENLLKEMDEDTIVNIEL